MFDFFLKVFTVLFKEEALTFLSSSILFLIFFLSLKSKTSIFLKIFFILIVFFYNYLSFSPLSEYFSVVGTDSVSEIAKPSLAEVIFFFSTFINLLVNLENISQKKFLLVLFSSFCVSYFIFILIKYYFIDKKIEFYKLFLKYLIIGVSIVIIFNTIYGLIKIYKVVNDNSKFLNITQKNIYNLLINKKDIEKDLLVIAYIGESTSAMHMSMYGYPFETNPFLDKIKNNKKLIKFENVYSSYTHTAPSLINALSFCNKNCDVFYEDNASNIFPIINILKETKVGTHLYSTQGDSGTYNFATSIALNTQNKIFSYNEKSDRYKGNKFYSDVVDHIFFEKKMCSNKKLFKENRSDLVLLHSSAGHGSYGGYLNLLPKNIPLINYPNYINSKNLLGNNSRFFQIIREYDTAIKYVDFSISKIFECISHHEKKPIIFIYFSDHGESPSTNSGHDSSRLNYEMIHVPLVVYFNDAAYTKYRNKFDQLNNVKKNNFSLTLVSDIILNLLNVEFSNQKDSTDKNFFYSPNNFPSIKTNFLVNKKLLNNSFIFVPTYWHEKDNFYKISELNFFNKYDTSIKIWVLNNFFKINKKTNKEKIENLVCQHRANSFISQFRALASSGCFETDVLFFDKNKSISAHSEKLDSSLFLNDIIRANYNNKKNVIWIEGKNITENQSCFFAEQWLKSNSNNFISILLELPSNSVLKVNDKQWLNCISKISEIPNLQFGYYVDTILAKKCSLEIKSKNGGEICTELYANLNKISQINSKISLTFDYVESYQAIKNNINYSKLKWHIWNIRNINDFLEVYKNDNLGILLLENSKNNSNIN